MAFNVMFWIGIVLAYVCGFIVGRLTTQLVINWWRNWGFKHGISE